MADELVGAKWSGLCVRCRSFIPQRATTRDTAPCESMQCTPPLSPVGYRVLASGPGPRSHRLIALSRAAARTAIGSARYQYRDTERARVVSWRARVRRDSTGATQVASTTKPPFAPRVTAKAYRGRASHMPPRLPARHVGFSRRAPHVGTSRRRNAPPHDPPLLSRCHDSRRRLDPRPLPAALPQNCPLPARHFDHFRTWPAQVKSSSRSNKR